MQAHRLLALSGALLALCAGRGVAAQDAPYPADTVLAAFATACSGIENMDVAKASASAAGWEVFDTVAHPDSAISKIIDYGKEAIAQDDETTMIDGGAYRHVVSGRELFLVLSGVSVDTVQVQGCRIYDLAATAPIDEETLEDWAVRAPQAVPVGLNNVTKQIWNPGLKPGHMEMEVSFIPQDADLGAAFGELPLSGLVFIATAMEFGDL